MQPSKFRTILLASFVIAIVVTSLLITNQYLRSKEENPQGDQDVPDTQDDTQTNDGETSDDNDTNGEITIVSWQTGWELVTCLPRETGETNYDLDGFLNVTVDNPTDHRVRMSLTVRYDYTFNYTLWGEPKTAHNSHKRTVTATIYEQWQRPYKFGLFYQPFDADNPPNLQIIRFDAEILDVSISN